MTRIHESALTDSLALEAAARRHRSQCLGEAFSALASWVEDQSRKVVRQLGDLVAPTRYSTH
jgi:hypothetical protein